jgi:type I site-specific restriction endonuclease
MDKKSLTERDICTQLIVPALQQAGWDIQRQVREVTELLALCDQLKACIAAARAKHAQLAEALVAQAVAR